MRRTGSGGGLIPPEHSRRVQGRFSRGSRGAGSPPSASAWPAPRSPESAQGANSPNALARGGGKQSRPAQQGKRFSARPSVFGGFGRMRRAGRVRGRRRYPPAFSAAGLPASLFPCAAAPAVIDLAACLVAALSAVVAGASLAARSARRRSPVISRRCQSAVFEYPKAATHNPKAFCRRRFPH